MSTNTWIVATTAVGLLGWAIGTFTFILLFLVGEQAPLTGSQPRLAKTASFAARFGLALGAVLGSAQAFALPTDLRGKLAWVIANAIRW